MSGLFIFRLLSEVKVNMQSGRDVQHGNLFSLIDLMPLWRMPLNMMDDILVLDGWNEAPGEVDTVPEGPETRMAGIERRVWAAVTREIRYLGGCWQGLVDPEDGARCIEHRDTFFSVKRREIDGVLQERFVVGGCIRSDSQLHRLLPCYWEIASWDVCLWLVEKMATDYPGVVGREYLDSMEMVLEEKREGMIHTLILAELRALGMPGRN